MTVEIVGVIALAFGIISLSLDTSFIVFAFLSFTLLGAAAAFVLESLGGTNISPAHLLLGFLAFKLLSARELRQRISDVVATGSPGFWLSLTTIYAVLSAYFAPRLFAGQTFIFPVRTIGYSIPLEPAMSNLTQSIYFVADFFCFGLFYMYAETLTNRRVLANAAIWCAALNLAFAALDLATYFTNTTELLSFIRNANYALLSETELVGYKRIVGSFTEASSFSSMTLGYFAFTTRLWLSGHRPVLTSVLSALSLTALLFSTSTTAYVGLSVFLLLLVVESVFRLMTKQVTRQTIAFVVGAPLILAILVLAIALNDASAAYVSDLLDSLVFNKMTTSSGVERSSWNSQALQNFVDTFGIGAGNGSLRASSFPVGVLGSIGVLGAAFFACFIFKVLFARTMSWTSDPLDDAFRQAARFTCGAWLIAATTSGALIDLGLPFFVFAALACSTEGAPSSISNAKFSRRLTPYCP